MAETIVTLKLTAPQFRTLEDALALAEETAQDADRAARTDGTARRVPGSALRETEVRAMRFRSLRKDIFE